MMKPFSKFLEEERTTLRYCILNEPCPGEVNLEFHPLCTRMFPFYQFQKYIPIQSFFSIFAFGEIGVLFPFFFLPLYEGFDLLKIIIKMEKSLEQNLSGNSQSEQLSPRSTFTTTFNEPSNELTKSKINSLPGHQKFDMSFKVPFIVVFQAIQIERLSLEIQALRVNLKDYQKLAFNCESYEIQIKQLTQQIAIYGLNLHKNSEKAEREIKLLTEEKQEKGKQLDEKQETIEWLKTQIEEKSTQSQKNERMILELTKKLNQKGQTIQKNQQKIIQLNSENIELRKENETLKETESLLLKLKEQTDEISIQLQETAKVAKEKLEEIEYFRKILSRLNDEFYQSQDLKKKFLICLEQNNSLIKKTEILHDQRNSLEEELIDHKFSLKRKEHELFEQKEEIKGLKDEQISLERQVESLNLEKYELISQSNKLKVAQRNLIKTQQDLEEQKQKHIQTQREYRKEKEKLQDINFKYEKLRIQLESLKKEGFYPEVFCQEYTNLKIQNQVNLKNIVLLRENIGELKKIILQLKNTLMYEKQVFQSQKKRLRKIQSQFLSSLEQFHEIEIVREELIKLMQENLKLEGDMKVLKIEMIQTQNRRSSFSSLGGGSRSHLSRKTLDSFLGYDNFSHNSRSKLSTKYPAGLQSTQTSKIR